MQSQTLTPEELAIFAALDAKARKQGRRITSHAEVYHVLKGLAYSKDPKPIVLTK